MTDPKLDEARELLEEGAFEEGLELVDGLEGSEASYLTALARFELGELDTALTMCRGASDRAETRYLEAVILLSLARADEALASARRAVELEPDWADSHYILGVVRTQRGEIERADRSFQRASELAPDDFETPFRLAPEAFDRAVEEALGLLPEEFAKYLENVEVGVEEVPTQELLQSGSSFDDLGLYIGASIQWGDSDFPDRILLFQRNLENISPDRETLVEEIRDTVLHEVGHHMGLEEDELPF
ncbi:MAG: hypothetical protein E2P02_12955 [Acidobacteria bacterium]|nr:MAG: hypothetical protein E2P02_12955 [Acidobacteriota bacterium]